MCSWRRGPWSVGFRIWIPTTRSWQFLYQITEPVLEPIRKLVPPLGGMIDISMLIAFFGIMILQQILVSMT